MIIIKSGEVFMNKTYKYLLPIVNTYSKEFIYQYNMVSESLLACGVNDVLYESAINEKNTHLLFLIYDVNGKFDATKKMYHDLKIGKSTFNQYLSFVRNYTHYINDYYFDNIKGNRHCVILKVPTKYKQAYDKCLESKFSLMFTKSELTELKINAKTRSGKPDLRYLVLTKDNSYRQQFEQLVNETFDTNIRLEKDVELDFPFINKNEIFNYKINKIHE